MDLLTTISGVDFDAAWIEREHSEVEGVVVNIIGVKDQIQNKRAAGRPKDHIDADWLERRQGLME